MICTGSYDKCPTDKYNRCSISFDKGDDAGYNGLYYLDLAPKKDFFCIWKNNIGKISEKENNEYYIREYWDKVLSKLDPQNVYEELDNKILLCYENENQFCHRHIVAAWFELFLNIQIPEVQYGECGLEFFDREGYYKDYSSIIDYLEKIIIESKCVDIYYYDSINDWYLSQLNNKKIKK